eukprot:CAMPEP_0185276838 /NCGR_PEP_ID=MMETSP1359-20130426/57138_1 /TAXON_ID=552665 /ORGANISM="Bigelowiella longifila, Strain CCMP242" /LENGTH=342 /DNA_ID=CAMNT_0027870665 /DNA_START=123 /DNA_END=1151 /DNA_ORIENTATION=-
MIYGRADPGAVVWNDRLYAIGANSFQSQGIAKEAIECFDFKAQDQEWKMLCTKICAKTTARQGWGRENFGAVVWKSRLLLLGGTRDQHAKSLEYLDLDDPYTGWTQLTQRMKNSYQEAKAVVCNDKLYMTGKYQRNVECLNLSDEGAEFQELPRRANSICYGLHVYHNRLYAVCEENVQCLHLNETVGWYTLPLKMSMRRDPGVAGWGHILFLVGGFEIVGSTDQKVDSRSLRYRRDLLWLDLRSKVLGWKSTPQRMTNIRKCPGVVVHYGTLYVFGGGGEGMGHSEDTMEHFDVSSLLQLSSDIDITMDTSLPSITAGESACNDPSPYKSGWTNRDPVCHT